MPKFSELEKRVINGAFDGYTKDKDDIVIELCKSIKSKIIGDSGRTKLNRAEAPVLGKKAV
jgi:hypothetical protein